MYIYQGTADPGSSLTIEQRKSKKMTKSFLTVFFFSIFFPEQSAFRACPQWFLRRLNNHVVLVGHWLTKQEPNSGLQCCGL
jgi:hypothetical protein